MKKSISSAFILLLLAGTVQAGENLIQNGGFEEPKTTDFLAGLAPDARAFYPGTRDTPFAGWAFGGGWDGGTYTVHVSDEAHSGKRSCEIRCETKGRGGIASSPFKLLPGTILKVSFWAKARNATGGKLFLNFEGTPGDGWNGLEFRPGTYDWMQVVKHCVVPVRHNREDGQTLMIFIYSKAEGSIWIDDVTVETVDVNEMAEAPDEPAAGPPAPEAIPEPKGSIGYRTYVAPSLEKVFPDTDYAPISRTRAEISLARNEYEAVQVVVEAPWRAVTIKDVQLSDLRGPRGALIPASALQWRRVDFVETTIVPPYYVERVGWYPDPLMPAGEFTVRKLSRTPVWITIKTPKDARSGTYRGTITIVPDGLKPTVVPFTVRVWDFLVPDETHLRTLTWLSTSAMRVFYDYVGWKPENREKDKRILTAYCDILLEHRLGPGGSLAAHVWKKRGEYDFSDVDERLEYLLGKGMNAFIMGTAPNLRRSGKKEYTPEFIAEFTERLKAYGDHLREKGWIDRAYVYTYDEAPRSAWPEVKKIAKAIKAAAPELRILQCLNEPEGVKALEGFIDVFDVYVAQYHRTGVAGLQQRGTEAWLAVCCYPMDHPNVFIEYPLLDARILPMFCWKYNAAGFEYWSPVSWKKNAQMKGGRWPDVPWDPNTFGRYNGDGYLIYPGADGVPYPSVRLAALRDGFEDYEYMWLLRQLVQKAESASKPRGTLARAKELLEMDQLITDEGAYGAGADNYMAFREKVARAIVGLRKLAGES